MPTSDLGIGPNRKAGHVGEVHRRAKREIRERERIAGDKFLALELRIQHFRGAMERFRAFGNCRRIRLAILEHHRFNDMLENEYRARGVPMREVPELPASHVESCAFVLRKETASRLLAG